MRRKKDNKRVLRGRPNNNKSNNNKRMLMRRGRTQPMPVRQNKQRKKTNKTLLIMMIVALIAFVVGAGLGVSMSFEDANSNNETPEFENVTVEMTSNLNETEQVYFDPSVDGVDYNNQQNLADLNLTNNTTTLSY